MQQMLQIHQYLLRRGSFLRARQLPGDAESGTVLLAGLELLALFSSMSAGSNLHFC